MKLTPEQLAADENTSPEELTKLAKQSIELLIIVAKNDRTNPELLRELATFKDARICQNIASNPNTPKDILFELAKEFPEEFLSNPILPLLWLENPDFAKDMPWYTISALLDCEKTPKKLRKELYKYPSIPF
jgi:hypothetical protein